MKNTFSSRLTGKRFAARKGGTWTLRCEEKSIGDCRCKEKIGLQKLRQPDVSEKFFCPVYS
jgi:hypothetical protein